MKFSAEFICTQALFELLSVMKRKESTNMIVNKLPFLLSFISTSGFDIVFRSTRFSNILDKGLVKEETRLFVASVRNFIISS
jgi:hypothetical protein